MFAFAHVDARTTSRDLGGGIVHLFFVVHVGGHLPKFARAKSELAVVVGAVPEDLVVEFVGLGVVVHDDAFVVFGALIHHLAERLEAGEHAGVVFVDALAVADVVFTQDEHKVDVRAQLGRNAKWVLHGDDQHHFPVATVHEQQAHQFVARPAAVVQTVVQDDEGAWIDGGAPECHFFLLHLLQHHLLALQHVFDDGGVVLVVDEQRWHQLSVEPVAFFRAGDYGAGRYVALVVQDVSDQIRLAGVSLANQHDHGTLGLIAAKANLAHIELFQFQCGCERHVVHGGKTGGGCENRWRKDVLWRKKKIAAHTTNEHTSKQKKTNAAAAAAVATVSCSRRTSCGGGRARVQTEQNFCRL